MKNIFIVPRLDGISFQNIFIYPHLGGHGNLYKDP